MSNTLSTNKFTKKAGIQKVKEYLEAGRSITPLEALGNWGLFRLATTINVLRKRGMDIRTDMKEDPNGKTYAQYTLVPKKELKVGAKVRVVKQGDSSLPHGLEGTVLRKDLSYSPVAWIVHFPAHPSRFLRDECVTSEQELEVI